MPQEDRGMRRREQAKLWYRQGVYDLRMAERNLEIGGYNVAAFLAQQSVEKLLKAAYLLEEKPIPRTHHLDELAKPLGLPEELYYEVISLTLDYALSRYPDVIGEVPFEYYPQS